MPKRSSEFAAYDRELKKEAEVADLEAFLNGYRLATGELLEMDEMGESPDAVCIRPDGSRIGVELTQVRRSPDDAHWQAVLDNRDEMDPEETCDEIWRLISQKAELRKSFRIERNILMIALRESDFRIVVGLAKLIPIKDLESTGFEEIWIADFKGIWDGAHREAVLFGLLPEQYRFETERSMFDQKPYG